MILGLNDEYNIQEGVIILKINNIQHQLKTISLVKVVCMFLVVFGHSCAIYSGNDWGGMKGIHESSFFSYFLLWLGSFHTQAFTFSSGFLFAYNRYKKNKYHNIKEDIINRSFRLLIPFFFFCYLWGIPSAIFWENKSVIQIIKQFVLISNPAQYWFLWMLFWIYIIFYFYSDCIIKKDFRVVFCILGFIYYFTSIIGHCIPIGYMGISNIMKYLIYYYLGVSLACEKINFNKLLTPVKILFLLLIDIIIFFISQSVTIEFESNVTCEMIFYPILGVLGIIVVYGLCWECAKLLDFSSKIYSSLAECAMGVYLVHQQILYLIIRITNIERFIPVITIILNYIICITISMLMVGCMRKFKLGRLVLGEEKYEKKSNCL